MKNWSRITTAVIIVIATVGLIVFDIVKAVDDAPRDTLSAVILTWGFKVSFVPFFFGVLGGHFFIPSKLKTALWKYIVLGSIFLTCGLVGTLVNNLVGFQWWTHPMMMVSIGFSSGALLWPQKITGV
jgi:hypothetical protein